MMRRLRLVDAVAVGAGAMLCLKVLGLVSGSSASDAARASPRAMVDERAPFAGALVRARTNFDPDVKATGTVVGTDAKAEGPSQDALRAPSEPAPVSASAAERQLLERLGERREQWQQKGKDLELRERLLEDAERKIEARINELKALEDKAVAAKANGADGEGAALKNLVTMYETMKPKEAARVFDRLTHEVLVPVVLQMNPRKMAEVLAVMSPEAAERLTVALATRAHAKPEGTPSAGRPPANELPAIEPAPTAKR
jgi:flagellar motility protein MotE (MotC chaperone)